MDDLDVNELKNQYNRLIRKMEEEKLTLETTESNVEELRRRKQKLEVECNQNIKLINEAIDQNIASMTLEVNRKLEQVSADVEAATVKLSDIKKKHDQWKNDKRIQSINLENLVNELKSSISNATSQKE